MPMSYSVILPFHLGSCLEIFASLMSHPLGKLDYAFQVFKARIVEATYPYIQAVPETL